MAPTTLALADDDEDEPDQQAHGAGQDPGAHDGQRSGPGADGGAEDGDGAAVAVLPEGWCGVLAVLGERDEQGRTLHVPAPGQPPNPALPLPLYLYASGDEQPGSLSLGGTIDRVWIERDTPGQVALHGSGRVHLDTEAGRELAGRLLEGPVRVALRVEDEDAGPGDQDDAPATDYGVWHPAHAIAGHPGPRVADPCIRAQL